MAIKIEDPNEQETVTALNELAISVGYPGIRQVKDNGDHFSWIDYGCATGGVLIPIPFPWMRFASHQFINTETILGVEYNMFFAKIDKNLRLED